MNSLVSFLLNRNPGLLNGLIEPGIPKWEVTRLRFAFCHYELEVNFHFAVIAGRFVSKKHEIYLSL